MTRNRTLTAAAIAAVAAAALGTAYPAIARGPGGPAMFGGGPMQMLDFATLDTDKDGKITKAELDARRQAAVAETDANKDGKLSVDELTAQEVRLMTEGAKAHAARMIADFDADGDGLLSAAELAARPMPARLFARIDTDGDGAISQAEADTARDRMAERMSGGPEGGKRHHRPFVGDGEQN